MIKVGVGIPAFNSTVDVGHAGMWLSFGSALAYNEERFELVYFKAKSISNIDIVRNELTQEALDANCDWLVMVDADNFIDDGSDLLRMIRAADDCNKDSDVAMIGMPVVCRCEGHPVNVHGLHNRVGNLSECTRIGSAIIAINLNWVRKHWATPPWFVTVTLEGSVKTKVGEDFYFCDGVTSRGGKTLVYHGVVSYHVASRSLLTCPADY